MDIFTSKLQKFYYTTAITDRLPGPNIHSGRMCEIDSVKWLFLLLLNNVSHSGFAISYGLHYICLLHLTSATCVKNKIFQKQPSCASPFANFKQKSFKYNRVFKQNILIHINNVFKKSLSGFSCWSISLTRFLIRYYLTSKASSRCLSCRDRTEFCLPRMAMTWARLGSQAESKVLPSACSCTMVRCGTSNKLRFSRFCYRENRHLHCV